MNKETGEAMTADEAKQKVLAVHPDAWACKTHDGWRIYGSSGFNNRLSSRNPGYEDKSTAWSDAASKLPTPIPTPASEPFSDNFSEAAAFAGITFSQGCQFSMKMNHLLGRGPEPGFLLTPPSTEESGESVAPQSETGKEVYYCACGGGMKGDSVSHSETACSRRSTGSAAGSSSPPPPVESVVLETFPHALAGYLLLLREENERLKAEVVGVREGYEAYRTRILEGVDLLVDRLQKAEQSLATLRASASSER